MKNYINFFIALLFCVSVAAPLHAQKPAPEQKPNIVLIYADDLGYGDISSYGGEIPTPHIDDLAKNGIKFTNAYATAATCTPSRYALLTGTYAWRRKGTGVADGDATSLILPGRTTLPGVLQQAGYTTGVVGKWHLGLGEGSKIDWNEDIKPGPLEIGFDYAFLIPATADRVPTVFVENHKVVNLDPSDPIQVNYGKKIGEEPTGSENPNQLTTMYTHGHDNTIVNGVSRIGYMTGGKSALWRDQDIADILVEKASAFIEDNQKQPFFLYLSTSDIHVPRLPHERFAGVSGKGVRGDVILQLDYTVGAVQQKLRELDLDKNTIVIFTSDNGPVLDDGYLDGAAAHLGDHNPFGPFRGGKYSAYEAGTRIPFILRWKGKVAPGKQSSALVSQVDLLRSFAALTGQQVPEDKAIDSEDHWKTFIDQENSGRTSLVQEALRNALSYVKGDFKYIEPSDGPAYIPWVPEIESGLQDKPQLYNLAEDPGETKNLASELPDKTEEMMGELEQIKNKMK